MHAGCNSSDRRKLSTGILLHYTYDIVNIIIIVVNDTILEDVKNYLEISLNTIRILDRNYSYLN